MRLASRLLAAILPPTLAGRSTLGDLLEEFHRRPRGPRRHVWFWIITIDLVTRYLPGRLTAVASGAVRDVVYALRLIRRYPALIVSAVLSLSLAIGVSTAAFSIANSVWLRPNLSADSSIVKVWRRHANGASMAWPASELSQLREEARSVTIEGVLPATESIGLPVDPAANDTAAVEFVTGGYFAMLDPRAFAGRTLDRDDDRPGAPPVAVLDHLYWRRHFGADAGMLGRILSIRGVSFTVVGIASRDFIDPIGRRTDLWAPLASAAALAPAGNQLRAPQPFAIGRLKSGVTMRQADAEIAGLLTKIAAPAGSPRATAAETVPVISGETLATNRVILAAVFAVISLVLVLACANVSNLQLAGAAARRQETAIRLSCGAGRRRLIRQFLTESALLSAVSGALGFVFARWLAPLLAAGVNMPAADVDPDPRVYAFVVIAAATSAIGTGLAPAYFEARGDIVTNLTGSRGRGGAPARASRVRSIFIGSQAAASLVLVALAALQVRALVHIAWMDPGFDVASVLTVSAPFPRTPAEEARAAGFWPVALERVRAIRGVDRATVARFTPFGITFGSPDEVHENAIDAGYFATIGLRLTRGRSFTAAEVAAHEKLAVISEQVARRFWPDEDPLGASGSRIDADLARFQVIGIAGDALIDRVHDRRPPMVYLPLMGSGGAELAIRTRNPRAMAPTILAAVRALSPGMQPAVTIVSDSYAREFERPRRAAVLGASVAVFALVLSVAGLFGVTSFAVRTRTREIGIRMALGARRGDVVGLLIREGLRPVAAGLISGMASMLLAGHVVAGLLYGLSGRDPLALSVAAVVLLGAAVAAVVVPSRRAARLDPAMALRDA